MKSVAIPLILILGGVVAAQIPASGPAASAPSSAPPSAPSTAAPDTLPTTAASTAPAGTMPATQASSATAPSTGPTTGLASTRPSGGYYSSSSYYGGYSRRNRFGESDRFQSSTAPTTSADAGLPDMTPKTYPTQYAALLNRSIFIKGSQRVFDPFRDPNDPRNQQSANVSPPTTPPAPYMEGVLVFDGASDVDGQLVAFLENTGMNTIARYHVGDPVGQGTQGKIAAITLDSIDYQVGARVTHVLLGQNLNGQVTQVLTTQPVFTSSSSPTPGTTTTGGSTSGGIAPASSGGSTDSILERMRRRRMQELGK